MRKPKDMMVTIRVERERYQAVRKLLDRYDLTFSEWVRAGIERVIENDQKEKAKRKEKADGRKRVRKTERSKPRQGDRQKGD